MPPTPLRYSIEWDEQDQGRIIDRQGTLPNLHFAIEDCVQDLAELQRQSVKSLVTILNARNVLGTNPLK